MREEGGREGRGRGTCLVFSQECVHITSHCNVLWVTMASVTDQLIVPTATKINESSWVVPGPWSFSLPPYPGVRQVRAGPQLKTRNIHINIFP